MKAKEIVEKFVACKAQEGLDAAVLAVAKAIVDDISNLIETRKVTFASAYKSVFKETYSKFQAACRLDPEIPVVTYHIAVKANWPEGWSLLMRDKVIPDLDSLANVYLLQAEKTNPKLKAKADERRRLEAEKARLEAELEAAKAEGGSE